MKKSLFAIAAVTAFAGAAQAQSSVTVYGIMDVGYAATKTETKATAAAATTTGTARNTGNGDGALSTSRIGFKGVEDLGKGQKAEFVLEYDLANVGVGGAGTDSAVANTATNTTSTGTGFAARYAYVGLSDANLGGVRLGRQEQAVFTVLASMGLAGAGNNMPGSIYSSGANTAVNTYAVRPVTVFLNQAVTYMSPTIAGVQVTAQYSANAYEANAAAANAGARESGANITYTGVKNLQVGYGIAQQDTEIAAVALVAGVDATGVTGSPAVAKSSGKTTQQALAANYNFGVVQPFANWTSIKTLASGVVTRNQTAIEIGIRAPITPTIGVWASGFSGKKDTSANDATLTATTTGRADISGYQVGATYALSKRTTTYAIYGTQGLKGRDAAVNTKLDSSGYAIGVRHTF
jgi:predicted porin